MARRKKSEWEDEDEERKFRLRVSDKIAFRLIDFKYWLKSTRLFKWVERMKEE